MAHENDIADELVAEAKPTATIADLPPDMPRWMARTICAIDAFSLRVGKIVCWLTVALFITMTTEVFLRYVFHAPTIWAYDTSRMLYGALFMLGAGYALSKGVHIRADFLYRTLPPRAQGAIDCALYFLCYFPGLILFFIYASQYAFEAWARGEVAMDTAWAPYLGPVRTAMPLGILFLLIQGVSELLKSIYTVGRGKWPLE